MNKYILLISVLTISLLSHSYTFKKYQVNNGLSENSVQVILQDHLGFMWFGTKDGLNRFDGYEFKVYKSIFNDTTAIGNNFIRAIYQDHNHNFWIGTDSYMYSFNYNTEKFQLFSTKSDLNENIHSGIQSICSENDSILWIGTRKQGAFCLNTKNGKLKQYIQKENDQSLNSNIIWQIFRDYSGTIWLGSREGLSRYNRETDSFYTYTSQNTQRTLVDDEILSINEDAEGNLWVGTWAGGLARLNKSSNTFDSFLNFSHPPFVSHIRSIMEYDRTTLLVGADDGLYLLNKKTGESSRIDNTKDFNSLSDQNIYSIYKDHEGGIWIGTYFGGINYMSPNANIIEHYYPNFSDHSLSGKAVRQFCEDKSGNLWIATEDAGLNYFNTKTKHFKVYLPSERHNSLSYHNIHSLVLDDYQLWIGTFSRGIDILNLKNNTFRNYSFNKDDSLSVNDNCIFAMYKDSKGDIYIGTPYGLCRYNRETDNFTRILEVSAFVYDITEDYLGSLWVASYSDGAYRFDYKTGKWKNYPYRPGNSKSIAFNKLTCVYLDGKQRLWFGTEGRGICKYNYETDDFVTIDERDGLPNNVIYSILDDKYGNIWLSSNQGISKLNPATMEIKTYMREDGLQGNQFNYRSGYKSKDGVFYFGGINGFNAFNPDNLTDNTHVPPMVISLFEILSEEKPERVKVADKIKLKYNQASFRINFVSLSFQAQEKNNYRYKMDGLDEKWTDIGSQRTVSFINLSPGKYTFKVIGSNNDGVWNEEGASIEITIMPPFWKSTVAKGIYILILFSLIYYIIQSYTKRVRWKQELQLDQFQKEKEKEMYDAKIDFFTNIAHEIRTPVSLIKAPLECIVNSGDGNLETKDNLSVIERNTDRLLELINQLLDFRKIEEENYKLKFTKVNVKNLLSDICFRFRPAAESRNLNVTLQLPTEDIFIYLDKEALIKIVSNLLTNALKYGQKTVEVSLTKELTSVGVYVELKVCDDGIGIADDMKERVFEPFFQIENNEQSGKKTGTGIGLALTKQLVKRHNGEIYISNEKGKGAVFVVKIPEHNETTRHSIQNETIIEEKTIEDELNIADSDKTTILIVEDNEELRTFLSKNLIKDHHILTASDGEQALKLLEDDVVDLVISDIVMPIMNGLELSKAIKQNEQFSHIPVVLLSAKTNTQTKVEGLEHGADSYIEKPFSVSYLKAQINSLIENRIKILEKFSRSPIVPYGAIARNKKDEVFLVKLNREIEQNLSDDQFSIEKLAIAMSMSQSNFQRKIKGISGMVPSDYIKVFKLKKAAQLLKSKEYRINEICYVIGYSPSYFTKCFQKQFGILPKDFVKEK